MLKWFPFRRKMLSVKGSVIFLLCFIFMAILYMIYSRKDILLKDFELKMRIEDSVAYCNSPGYITGAEHKNIDGFTLKQLQILIRHGDRAPIHPKALLHTKPMYMSCSFNSTNLLQVAKLRNFHKVIDKNTFVVTDTKKRNLIEERQICKPGQLTPIGYLQHLYNGEHMRRSYSNFLSTIDLKSGIFVQATNVPRTIQSSSAFVTGMFYDELMINAYSIPIKVYSDRVSHAHFLLDENANDLHCPKLEEKTDHVNDLKKMIHFNKNIEPMMQTFAKILLMKRESLPQFNYLVDTLYTRLCHGQDMPHGPLAKIPRSLVKQALQFSHMYSDVLYSVFPELQSLSILSQMARNALHMLMNEDDHKKFVLFSGHDTTVAPFIHILGVNDGKWPPYASRIVFEFYVKDDIYSIDMPIIEKIKATYFRVIYNGLAHEKLTFCSDMKYTQLCSLEELFVYVSNGLYHDELELIDEPTFREMLFARIKNLCSTGE